jgi:hypothetical protein
VSYRLQLFQEAVLTATDEIARKSKKDELVYKSCLQIGLNLLVGINLLAFH